MRLKHLELFVTPENSTYGRDYRNKENINKNRIMESVNGQGKFFQESIETQNKRISNIVINASGDSNIEVSDARADEKGNVHESLKDRLDTEQRKLEELKTQTGEVINFRYDDPDLTTKMKEEFRDRGFNIWWYLPFVPNTYERRELWDWTFAFKKICEDIIKTKERKTITIPSGVFKILETVEIDISYISINGDGVILDASGILKGPALRITGSKQDHLPTALNQKCAFINGISVQGNTLLDRGEIGTIGIEFSGDKYKGPNSLKLYNVDVSHFEKCLIFGNHAYVMNFFGCGFSKSNIAVYAPKDVVDGGERLSFFGCTFANSDLLIKGENPNGSFHFETCSFDYTNKFFELNGMQAFCNNCHFETANDRPKAPPFSLVGNGATLVITGGKLLFGSQVPTYPYVVDIQSSKDLEVGGGFILRDVFLFNVKPISGIFASGSGNVTLKNWYSYDTSELFEMLYSKNNCLLDGDFERSALLDNWFITKDSDEIVNKFDGKNISLMVSKEDMKTGSQSLKIVKKTAGGNPAIFVIAIPIVDRDARYACSFDFKNKESARGNVYSSLKWGLVENNQLGIPTVKHSSQPISSKTLNIQDTTNWTNVRLSPKRRSPAWATHVLIEFNAAELTTGSEFFMDGFYIGEM